MSERRVFDSGQSKGAAFTRHVPIADTSQEDPTTVEGTMRRHITPSFVLSLVALFVALGGSSYAAVKLQKNSVTSREIRNGSVTMSDLAKSARPSKDNRLFRTAVADTLSTDQVLTALSGAVEGDPGPTGAQGATGAQGPQGSPGIILSAPSATHSGVIGVGPGGFNDTTVNCPAGKDVAGGVGTPSGSGEITISEKVGNGWHIRLQSTGGSAQAIATVFCA